MNELKSTPLVNAHQAANARMVPFSGWLMPVQYDGILAEHHHTRNHVSLFDCSHMGQFRLSGPNTPADLDTLLPRMASNQPLGSCRYNFLLNDQGTVVDDIIVYRLAEHVFYIVVNAGTIDADAAHIQAHLSPETAFTNESAATAKLDLQGPEVFHVMHALGFDIAALPKYFRCLETTIAGVPGILSRTGYTGEAGFEFYLPAERAVAFWNQILAIEPVKPAGLGARDTLRLEMGYPLYGHELSTDITPLEAGFAPMLDLDRTFIGSQALRQPPTRQLVGIALEGRRAAREGTTVEDPDGNPLGTITSGSFSPSLGTAIALAYLPADQLQEGRAVVAVSGRTRIPGRLVSIPFYQQGSARARATRS